MKETTMLLALAAAGVQASTTGKGPCCFQLTASGGPGGVVGQLNDGQNRIGDKSLPAGTYCIDMQGGLTDEQGRGCILTPPTSQWQCDVGAKPTVGFSVDCDGVLSHDGNSEFWSCPTGDHEGYNIYSQPLEGEPGCRSTTLTADNCKHCIKTSTYTAPCSTSSKSESSWYAPSPSLSKPESSWHAPSPSSSTPCSTLSYSHASSSSSSKPWPTPSSHAPTSTGSKPCSTSSSWSKPSPSSSKPCSTSSTWSKPSSSSSKPCSTSSTWSKPSPASSKPCSTSSSAISPPQTWTPKPTPPTGSSSATHPSKTPSKPVQSPNSKCPAELPNDFQFPHLIVPVNSEEPTKAYGSVLNGTAGGSISTIFTFDIPQSYEGKTCHLDFYLPRQNQLETSAFTLNGEGVFSFAALNDVANDQTTCANMPTAKWSLGETHLSPGNAYQLGSGPHDCPAGKSISFIMSPVGDSSLNYFQDWNPCPIGLWIIPN